MTGWSTAPNDRAESSRRVAALCASNPKLVFPPGLTSELVSSIDAFPMRIMIVDNSGSMQASDGARLVQTDKFVYRRISCSRWQELSEEVNECASLAAALNTRLDVHLLNPSLGFSAMSICPEAGCPAIAPRGPTGTPEKLREAIQKQRPGGTTPLTEAVINVVAMIEPVQAELRSRGQRVVVIIATDGLPNDRRSFVSAMQRLQCLPVWVVVRLCTDEDAVVDYWNDLDRALEAPLEVLDDVCGEAAEVGKANAWLTYSPALPLARMLGLPSPLYDALDEATLLPSQVKQFLEEYLGCDALPEPALDPRAFAEAVKAALGAAAPGSTLEPRCGKLKPWVDLRELERAIQPRRCLPRKGQ